jgi:fructose/tagatose bisphosphate aldolase
MKTIDYSEFIGLVENSIEVNENNIRVTKPDVFKKNVYKLAEVSALGSGVRQGVARFVIRSAAMSMGIYPASINDLYLARGRGETHFTFTVPAMNLRVLAFDSARAVFRAARKLNAGTMIFEIARSEMNYTDQRPTEYSSSILAAAVAEGYRGPVFIQGDHFQVSAKRYASDSFAEINSLKTLIDEALAAGFFNIDVDTSTMVDLIQTTIPAQQKLNVELSSQLTAYIRSVEPQGMTISVGGEIGEVGGHNSTEEEMHAYLDGFRKELDNKAPKATGLSKISIQTGTSHGGVVLADGSIAKVNVDFKTLLNLSRLARKNYGLGGAVQHGASTLPEDAFHKFVESEACEVHLATNFMNLFFENIPADFKNEIYAYLREKQTSERKPDMTDEQFYYKTRKNAVGPFKAKTWNLPAEVKEKIGKIWENQFLNLFTSLGLKDTYPLVDKFIKPMMIAPKINDYVGDQIQAEDVKDLAD